MNSFGDNVRAIERRRSAAWSVLSGGTCSQLDGASDDGAPHYIALPFDALTGLRMWQIAPDARVTDGSLRTAQWLDGLRVERAEKSSGLSLQQGRCDDFDVAFVPDRQDVDLIAADRLTRSKGNNQPTTRRRDR